MPFLGAAATAVRTAALCSQRSVGPRPRAACLPERNWSDRNLDHAAQPRSYFQMRTSPHPSLPCRGARRHTDPGGHRHIEGASPAATWPIRSESWVKLVTAIARGRQWLSDNESGSATIEGIATREAYSKRHIQMTISLAFLALSLVKAAVEGRLPRGIGVARPFDAPVARQQQMLGLTADASR
jgi:hypothetical protein